MAVARYSITFFFVENMYYRAPEGHNCAYNDTISSLELCQQASQFLGIEYRSEVSSKLKPAGCYWRHEEEPLELYGHFNLVIDPDEAYPTVTGAYHTYNTGGICLKTGQL